MSEYKPKELLLFLGTIQPSFPMGLKEIWETTGSYWNHSHLELVGFQSCLCSITVGDKSVRKDISADEEVTLNQFDGT